MSNFQRLQVWQEAKQLAISVYRLCQSASGLRNDYGLSDQMRRSAVSVPSNIAEGATLSSDKQGMHYFMIAKASLSELVTQIHIAREVHALPLEATNEILSACAKIGVMLSKLIQSRMNMKK